MPEKWTIAVNDHGCLSLCLSCGFAVQTQLNGLRSCWGGDSWTLGTVLDESPDVPHRFDVAFTKLLWPLVYTLCP